MKSLHLTNAWHKESGGIATYYRALAAEAKKQERSLALVVPGERNSVEHDGSTRIYTVAAAPSPFNSKYRLITPNMYPGVNRRVLEILLEEQPDLLEVCDKYSLHYMAGLIRKNWLPQVTKRPVLLGLSCERMDDNLSIYLSSGKLGQLFAHFYMKWIYFGFFDHHVTVSNYTVDELLLAGRGHIRERGIWVRGMGVDLDTFSPSHRSPELRAALLRRAHAVEGTRLLLYVGRLAPEKNLGLLVDAFARLPQSDRLLIAGDGIERASLEQKCRKCFGDRVQFLGHQPDRLALAQLYANCDLFVHPNPKEPFGIAPLEAMASGLPMVVPNTGGVLTYANSSNAWLAAPNPAAFSAAIEQALIAPEREEKRARAFADAQQYHWHAVARRYLDLYRDIAAGASPHDAEFRSTPGNWLGQEFAALAPSARLTAQTPPPSPPKA